ncbi:septation protein SpoVG family protein [Elusimicrobiota bacterium]
MKKLLLIFLATLFITGVPAVITSYSNDISVTEVEVQDDLARIVINDVIEINEVRIKGKNVEFPEYISKSGNVYPQINFLTEEAKKEVVDAIMKKKPSKKLIKKISYKVSKMSPYSKKDSSLKAFAAVTFNGAVEVECKVMKSKREDDEYWVAWPSRPPDKEQGERKWVDQVSIVNRKVKSIIESDLVERARNTAVGGIKMTDEDVDIKEGLVNVPLTVTDIKVRKVEDESDLAAIVEVDLNYSFRIMDIRVYKRKDQLFMEFPVYRSDGGREYEQIKIYSRKLRAEIMNAIEKNSASEDKSNKIGYEITKFEQFWKDSALKYFCSVTINGAVEIECKIIAGSDYDPFVGWPSSKENDAYVDKIVPCNQLVKDTIEAALIKRYKKEAK